MSNAAINGPDIDANALSGAYQQLTSYLPVQPLVLPYPVRSSRMASTSQKNVNDLKVAKSVLWLKP